MFHPFGRTSYIYFVHDIKFYYFFFKLRKNLHKKQVKALSTYRMHLKTLINGT